jgi:hypothetical protein
LPAFPEFAKASSLGGPEVIANLPWAPGIPSQLHPTTIWSWDAAICTLGKSLCIWYEGGNGWPDEVSLLNTGEDVTQRDVEMLLSWCSDRFEDAHLCFVSQHTRDQLAGSSVFTITRDDAEGDYIYDVGEMVSRSGSPYRRVRRELARIDGTLGRLDTRMYKRAELGTISSDLMAVSRQWLLESATEASRFAQDEIEAIERMVLSNWPLSARSDLRTIVLSAGDEIVAWVMVEVDPSSEVVGHFMKYRPTKNLSLSHAVFDAVAGLARDAGASRFNAGPDMGFGGIRQFKESWRPSYLRPTYQCRLASI